METEKTREQLLIELEEANETIEAIRSGMVDAFVVRSENGPQLYTLKTADQTYRILIEKMGEGALTLNAAGMILYSNPRFAEMVGLSMDQAIGRCFDDFLPGFTTSNYNRMNGNGQLTDFKTEDILTTTEGKEIPVLLSMTNLNLEDGTALSIICTDITAQKEAQRKGADLDNQRKITAQKDEFIGVASHELKTPLTSLKAYLQLISNYKKEIVPEPVKRFIGKAELSILKLQRLVDDLLDVSKIQAGKLNFSKIPLNMNDLISACVENAAYMYPDYNLQFTPGYDCYVRGNAERLEQVVMNLISNAVKYSPVNKDILLKVACEDAQIKVTVQDFGIGLSEVQQEKIFDRFYRVNDQNYMIGGLGMGLYISTEIMKSHDGSIGVTSKIGEGSTFHLFLPSL